ncbi:FAD-binding protein [Phenylobacterium immobile]|uniref:FAD-binding protein n=1 Tax=Phenylobacterium immobile TaxID=21 RepID=UPI000A4BFC63|nr:FAD-binding protein [Phenylobacterium immobile]
MQAGSILKASAEGDVVEAVAAAKAAGLRLAIRGGGSKAGVGAPTPDAVTLDLSALSGVIDYDPAELLLTVRPATPLADVLALVAAQGQMLAFDPFDHGPIFGEVAGAATIGGAVCAGVSGSRRLSRGAARDHLLGFRAVSGRGETLIGGSSVVKNVTGYDLPKLVAGSWGRLAAVTQMHLKVVPHGPERVTLAVDGLDPAAAYTLMARAMGSQADVAAAAHLPTGLAGGRALTAMRLEGFGPSVRARSEMLAGFGAAVLPAADAEAVWEETRSLSTLDPSAPLWRVNTAPRGGPAVVAALAPLGARWLFDWAGGLTWLTFDGDVELVRQAAAGAGGHATLIRGPEAQRRVTPTFQPATAGVRALEQRVRQAFDPDGVFDTGRFTAGA